MKRGDVRGGVRDCVSPHEDWGAEAALEGSSVCRSLSLIGRRAQG